MGNFIKQALLFMLGCGILLAVLRVFDYDPFGIVSWLFSWFSAIVNGIADFLIGNDAFRRITRKPE